MRVHGNLNMEAGGNEVFLWYQKSSGHVKYNEDLQHALGLKNPVVDIALTSDARPESQVREIQ